MHCSKEALQLQRVDDEGRSALHRACDEGNKEEVLTLLPQLKKYKILKEELLRLDKTGRTPLGLAQAPQHDESSDESDELFQAQADTIKAMLEWIQQNDPDILDEVKTW